jgi:glucan phosphoethanolaminetransferase (alkaline phosphatase superfamily)
MTTSNTNKIISVIFIATIIFIYIINDKFYSYNRILSIGLNIQHTFSLSKILRQSIFFIQFCIAIYIFIILPFLPRKLSIPISLFLLIFYIIDHCYFLITGKPASLTVVSLLNGATGNIFDAYKEYKSYVLTSIFYSICLFTPIFIMIYYNNCRIKIKYFIVPISILFIVYFSILVNKGETGLMGFPKGFSYIFHSLAIKINDIYIVVFNKSNKINIIDYNTNKINLKQITKIVVIIDESIEYRYFKEVKDFDSPFLFDYGQAFSGGNCSASSNYLIRRGYFKPSNQMNKLIIYDITSLFKLAKDNNYKTVYIDNQNVLNDPAVSNYFDDSEISNIDIIINYNVPNYQKDNLSLEKIHDVLQLDNKIFIMINKIGAHFPYENTIPERIKSENKEKNYINSIKYNSIQFLNDLVKIIDTETIVFYTSDHGQDLRSKTTHCNTGDSVTIEEYSVPFLIFLQNQEVANFFRENHYKFKSKLTHIEFSETIRNIMGYQIVGLSSPLKDILPGEYYCGLYGQPKSFFGLLPSCKQLK